MANPCSKLQVLLIDDEAGITNIIKKGLERSYGHQVDVFNDPVNALKHFKSDYYDIVVLDIRMPGMDGLHLSREIRQRDSNCRICFMTAFEINESEARKVMPTLPSHCFIRKPVAISALASHIQSHFVKEH